MAWPTNINSPPYVLTNPNFVSYTATATDVSTSGTTIYSGQTVTVNPAGGTTAIITAGFGKAIYTGSGDITGVGHCIGSLGWAVMNANTRTAILMIGVEGKIDNTAGTITSATPGQFQISSNAGTIGTAILADCQLITSAGTITIIAGMRTNIINGAGTIGTVYGTFFATPTIGGGITSVIANVVQDVAGATNVRAFEGQISSGSNKFNLYMSGTASNTLAGKLYLAQDTAALQTTCALYAGSGVPNNSNGANGDFYFRGDTPGTVSQRLYIRSAGSWVALTV